MANGAPRRVVRLIALFKLIKALALLASLAIVFNLVHHDDPADTIIAWALTLHVDPHNHYLRSVLAVLFAMSPKRFTLLMAGTLLYVTLFTLEGIGLWLAKAWAEYLTIVATAGFIPVEVYEIVQHVSFTRILLLAINVAIVVYLIVQVRHRPVSIGAVR